MKLARASCLAAATLTTFVAPAQTTDDSLARGKQIWQQTCVACHGPDGRSPIPGLPDFTRRPNHLGLPVETLVERVRDGFKSPGSTMAMPPRGGNPSLSDQDIRAVVDYLLHRFRRDAD